VCVCVSVCVYRRSKLLDLCSSIKLLNLCSGGSGKLLNLCSWSKLLNLC
jgi:hypothetical protein